MQTLSKPSTRLFLLVKICKIGRTRLAVIRRQQPGRMRHRPPPCFKHAAPVLLLHTQASCWYTFEISQSINCTDDLIKCILKMRTLLKPSTRLFLLVKICKIGRTRLAVIQRQQPGRTRHRPPPCSKHAASVLLLHPQPFSALHLRRN